MTRLVFYFAAIASSVLHSSSVRIFADYKPTDLYELAGTADIAAVGEIVEVREKTFVLKIHRVLLGEATEKLEITRFEDWACATRWDAYRVGQKVVVFATKTDSGYVLPGAGGEAESPIVDGNVFCSFPCKDIPYDRLGKAFAPKISLEVLCDAVQNYRACFRVSSDKNGVNKIEQIASAVELERFVKSSKLHRMLVEQTLTAQQELIAREQSQARKPPKQSGRKKR